MTNEEKKELRKDDILALAKIIKQGRADWKNEKCDTSDFSTDELSSIGILNLSLAAYLYDSGCRIAGLADVTVIVENGQVTGVYSDNDNLAAEVIDLDVQNTEVLEQLTLYADKVQNTQQPIW